MLLAADTGSLSGFTKIYHLVNAMPSMNRINLYRSRGVMLQALYELASWDVFETTFFYDYQNKPICQLTTLLRYA